MNSLKIRAIKALTRHGFTDEEITKVFSGESCTKRTIANWRKKHDIPPGGLWTDDKIWRLRALHSKGYSDRKIADEMGFHPQLIKDAREKIDLEANGHHTISDGEKKIKEMIGRGCTDSFIASELDWKPSSIKNFRLKNDIESGGKHRDYGLVWYVLHGFSDREIAKRFGSSTEKIKEKRRKKSLPNGEILSWDEVIKICDLRKEEGLSVKEISDRLDRDQLTVVKTIKGLEE